MRLGGDDVDHAPYDLLQLEAHLLEAHLVRVELREIENVVDDLEEMIRRASQLFSQSLLLAAQAAFQ